jgi:hypothetical protein
MNFPVLIPSRGRASLFEREGCTVQQFSPSQMERVYYFVRPDEFYKYLKWAEQFGFKVIPVTYDSIGEKRKVMGEWAREQDHPYFFMADDDLKWFQRKSEAVTSLVPCEADDIDDMWEIAEHALLTADCIATVGISAREGNNRFGPGPRSLLVGNTRVYRAGLFRTEAFLSVQHARLKYFEDFDVQLQLLENGFENRLLAYYAQDQRGTNAKGGCSIERTHLNHEEAAKGLHELHPNVVSLRQKANKTGGAFGTRTEVTVQWKKAMK